MDDLQKRFNQLLDVLKEHENALLALEAKIDGMDDRLEVFRLEALAVSQATWLEMASPSKAGKALLRSLRKSAAQIKEEGLLLLEKRLPDKAARLGTMDSFIRIL